MTMLTGFISVYEYRHQAEYENNYTELKDLLVK